MADIVNDLQNLVTTAAGNTWSSAVSGTGGLTTVDLSNAGADRVSVLIACTTVTGAGNVTFKLQQSADGSTWADIPSNTASTVSSTAVTAVQTYQLISFNVIQRYVRLYATLNSGTSINVVTLFMAQQKYTPDSFGGWVNDTFN